MVRRCRCVPRPYPRDFKPAFDYSEAMQSTQSQFVRAVLMAVTAFTLIVPGMDSIAKLLSADVSPLLISWFRFALTLIVLAPVVYMRGGLAGFFPTPIAPYLWRGLGLTVATLLFFTGVKYMPLADMVAIFFISPFVLTLISSVFLGEKVGWRRGLAIAVGFSGALLVIRPSFAELGAVALLPAGAAIAFAVQTAFTKRLASTADPWAIQCMSSIVGTVLLGVMILWQGTELPTALLGTREYALFATLAGAAILSHALVIASLRHMDAAVFAPLQYLEIVGATIFGFILFRDFPDAMRWFGMAIVIVSGLFVVFRERSLAREEAGL